MVLMIPIWKGMKIYFQQNDGSTLKAELVVFEIHSNDIIAFCNTLYEHGIDGSQIVTYRIIGFGNLIVNLTQLTLSSITPH